MSYVRVTKHAITLHRSELIEMLESRYGVSNIPDNAEVQSTSDNSEWPRKCIGATPIKIVWETSETFESFPEGEEVEENPLL